MSSFESLGLIAPLWEAVRDLGYENPTPIQEEVIPMLLKSETDLVALAQTGTGKTAAFGLPLLQKTEAAQRTTQGVILSPTRELCLQITRELKNYAKNLPGLGITAVYGGASIRDQARELSRNPQIIVATPGRIKDMIGRGMINLTGIGYCILDEADEMLNMGFYEDIKDILSKTPADKSTWLFSATMPGEVARIAREFMHKPKEVTMGTKNKATDTVRHEYYTVSGRHRYAALRRLVDSNPGIFSVIFCRTKRDTQKVAEKLIEDGYNAGAIHGDLSQNQRDMVMGAFRKKQSQLLVATDVAARGIDVDNITHVIHYQLPDEIETYTHRSGRTGRAGKSGVSMVIMTRSEVRRVRQIEKIIGQPLVQKQLPDGMEICEIQLYHLASKIRDTEINPSIEGYVPAIRDVLEDLSRDELIQKMVSVEFSRFYEFYHKNSSQLSEDSSKSVDSSEVGQGRTRYFINIGERDGFDWMELKDLLKKELGLGKEDIFHVDVKDGFSFFNTDSVFTPLVLETFRRFSLKGRPIHVEISSNPRDGKRGGFRKSKKKGWKSTESTGKKSFASGSSYRHKKKTKKAKKAKKGPKGRPGN
ncbi:DEAD/DEAH box helicase [Robiginitalea aurantiaca]|uniref:DEAD/DEAH box helicase n=1 Tax=Robiginitalea aurantiaca TaxID=3056915 RepID=A0ABT7WC88_9FLAO|nr:DEAD/DEAH box helicase [Robiginitalea aurantiaca]MDM9630540.1 DEAD/DEAH box helicase [Robiginitalea aurantiaca]